jgi:hypothetical protein
MGLLHGNRRSRSTHAERGNRYYPTFRLLERDVDDAPTRYEPQTLAAQKAPADPYEAWRAQREAERDRDRMQVDAVRWVQRQRGTAAAPTKEAAAAEAVRWVNRYRGSGATPSGRQQAPAGRVAGGPGGREHPADLVGA